MSPRNMLTSAIVLPLLFAAPCAQEGVAAPEPKGDSALPWILQETSHQDLPALPLRAGVPLASGSLQTAEAGVFSFGEMEIPVALSVSSRWPDGSVRWLSAEFLAPPLAAGQTLTGKLHLGKAAVWPKTPWEISADGPLRAHGLTVQVAGGEGELFQLEGGGLSAPLGFSFSARTLEGGAVQTWHRTGNRLEESTAFSATWRLEDEARNNLGRPVLRMITRLTLHRGSSAVHLAQTVEVLAGLHADPQWTLHLPLKATAKDADFRRLGLRTTRAGGKPARNDFGSSWEEAGCTLAVTDFRQLFPGGFRRHAGGLDLLFSCPRPEDKLVLARGFARTMHLWLWLGEDRPTAQQAEAHADHPVFPHTSAERACASEAYGRLRPADAKGSLGRAIRNSVDRLFRRAESRPGHFGFVHWGDFYDGEHTLSYSGHLDQEYDPALVMHLEFARTGNPVFMDRAMPLARHYADVDICHNGGSFQHRASRHRMESWIADIVARGVRKSVESAKGWDGTPATMLKLARKHSPGLARVAAAAVQPLLDEGASDEEILDLGFRAIALSTVRGIVGKLQSGMEEGEEISPKDFCAGVARNKTARDYGFKDAEVAFRPFFDRYGGSWDEFPSFHVDTSVLADTRHTGGHSLVESVVFAWWQTGDLRLREVFLRVARYHAEILVAQELDVLRAAVKREGRPRTRTVAWPILNLVRLSEALEGMEGQEDLLKAVQAAADEAAAALIQVPLDQHDGSIHAGITMEALARLHQHTQNAEVAEYLTGLARHWAKHNYDPRQRGFRYKPRPDSPGALGFTGLVCFGMAYAMSLEPDRDTQKILEKAWRALPKAQALAKPFAMSFRGAARAAWYLDN